MRALDSLSQSPSALVLGFCVVHAWLALLGLLAPGWPLGDVTSVYDFWSTRALNGTWYGVGVDWVYPALALVPMLVPAVLHDVFGADYTSVWLIMVTVLNALALSVFTRGLRDGRRIRIAWWWLAYLVLQGPVSLGRVDTVAVALAIIACSWLATRPWLAGLLLAAATWTKVWPAAVIGAVVAVLRGVWARVVLAGVGLTGLLVVIAAFFGGIPHLFSFLGGQASRNLQVEAVAGTPLLWQALGGQVSIVYNHEIFTNELIGGASAWLAAVLTPLMLLVVIGVLCWAWWLRLNGADEQRLFVATMLVCVSAFIVLNKVGSPQFETWLAVPVLAGLVIDSGRYRGPALLVMLIGALTQVVYPYWYLSLLYLEPWMLVVITVRNAALVGLLAWGLVLVSRVGAEASLPTLPGSAPAGLRSPAAR